MSEAMQKPEQEFDPAADLEALWWKRKRANIRLADPAERTRASSIGHPCERFIFYDRTVPADMRLAHSPELQAIFDLGKEDEAYVLRELEQEGAEIVARQERFKDPRLDISGTIDVRIRLPGWPRAIRCEVKALNPYTADQIRTAEDVRNHRQAWVRRYWGQQQTYLYLAADELGAFILFNKSTGAIRSIKTRLDYDDAELLLKKAERVKLAVLKNEPPPRTVSEDCERCPFLHVCGPDQKFGEGLRVISDPEFEAQLRRREQLEPAADEFDDVDRAIKSRLPKEAGEFVCGDFVLTRTKVEKKGYAVKPQTQFPTHIVRLKGRKP